MPRPRGLCAGRVPTGRQPRPPARVDLVPPQDQPPGPRGAQVAAVVTPWRIRALGGPSCEDGGAHPGRPRRAGRPRVAVGTPFKRGPHACTLGDGRCAQGWRGHLALPTRGPPGSLLAGGCSGAGGVGGGGALTVKGFSKRTYVHTRVLLVHPELGKAGAPHTWGAPAHSGCRAPRPRSSLPPRPLLLDPAREGLGQGDPRGPGGAEPPWPETQS